MLNTNFTKANARPLTRLFLAMLFILVTMSTGLYAQITINSVSSDPSGYVPGQTSTIEFTVEMNDPSEFEWVDYIVYTFPAGWTAALNGAAPAQQTFCGPIIVGGEGTNVFSVGIDDPAGMAMGGNGCGVIVPPTFVITLDVTVPAMETGDQDVSINVLGDGFFQAAPADETATLTLSEIMCQLTCPGDIVIDAEPGTCGANVTIDVPTFTGNCAPAPSNMSGFYPVGTTEVVFTADGTSPSGEVSCTITVTVNDMEMPTIDGPDDVIIDLDGGDCEAIYNYLITTDDACGNMDVTMSQSLDQTTIDNSLACPGGESTYSRVFNLQTEGILTDIEVTDIELGVFQSFNAPAVTVSIYELEGALSTSNLTLVSTNTLNLPNLFQEIFTFPIVATLAADKEYVVQVVTPGSSFNGFVMGTNINGQTAPSYFSSGFCGEEDFTNMANYGNFSLVMNVLGQQQSSNLEQTEGLPSGSQFPIGITTNTFVVTDVSGNTSEFSFDVEVLEFPDPITSLACNNLVNVSLGTDCTAIITPDMVLEGGPYGCYNNYTVTIKDEDDNAYGDMVTGDMVGQYFIAEVTDPSGNLCWGEILIEDKIGPMLECSTRTTQCTESTDPGAPLASIIRVNNYEPTNNIISPVGLSTTEVPLVVEGLDNASITDLNIDLDITHSWTNDLAVTLVSPEGTEVNLIVNIGCVGEDMVVTMDDEADLTYVDFNNSCTLDVPSTVGTYQPLGELSDFDGEDPNGTWIIRISDFFNGDGGQLNSAVLEISQQGGIVGLPIPEGATIQPLGNQSFFVLGLDPCGPAILSYEDDVNNMDCSSPFTQVIYRTYTATDESGNEAVSCIDTINVVRTDLGSLELPPNYDGLDQPAFSCDNGYPFPNISGSPQGTFCENVQMDYEDITIDICEGSYKVLRYWRIFEWCSSEVVEHTQIIKVVDNEGPSIQCEGFNDVISTSPSNCDASVLLPIPTLNDNCTAVPTYTVLASGGTLVQQGQNYSLNDLEVGTYTVTYVATDDCDNTSECSFDFTVEDNISPVAVCDQHTTVSLSFEETVQVFATTFDDGSYDECTDVTWAARRMNDNCGIAENAFFGDYVTFCCADVGETIMVEFRVMDENGNFNTCMVEVTVDDKIAPAIQIPPNVTLDCQDDYKDLTLTGGSALGFDNCEVMEPTFNDIPSIGSCGSGQVSRIWTVMDKSGLVATGTQTIFLINNDPFDSNNINFPNNVTLTNCGASTDPSATGEPIINDDICSQVSYTYWDDTFTIIDDACEIIYRKWTVIDQCQFNTNVPNVGIWEDIQVIEITNNVAPEFTTPCTNLTYDTYGECEGPIELMIDATDDCTPSDKLVFTYKIDFDFVGGNDFDQTGTGNDVSGVYPVGTHRIVWTVADRCGNQNVCDYTFTVRDAKAPTPYCLSSISTAVMNTNGQVEIWVSSFDLGATDNCTPDDQLTISFTPNGVTDSKLFSCDDIPSGVSALIEDIPIYVTDLAGNQDFCTVSVLVEDNEANFCDDVGMLSASGAMMTSDEELIKGVSLTATNVVGQEFFAEDDNGLYSFDLIPNMNYEISAEKTGDIKNGITALDIVNIQKHILGLNLFSSPYQTIAADTDNSGLINGADIIAIRKLLLNKRDEFPNDQKSWRFVDPTQTFVSDYDVFPYKEVIDIDFSSGNNIDQDYYGVKIGDVNNSANPANFTSNVDTRTANDLQFVLDNISYEANETIEIPVYASNFQDMIAYQLTIEYDNRALEIIDVQAGELAITEGNVNLASASEGIITTVWSSISPITTDEVLFTLIATAKKSGNLLDVFHTSSTVTEAISYNELEEVGGVEIAVREDEEIFTTTDKFTLYTNTPNPFSELTNINFDLPTTDQVSIQVYDMNGAQVWNMKAEFKAGNNTITVRKDMLNTSGVYYYTINTSEDSATGKMILID